MTNFEWYVGDDNEFDVLFTNGLNATDPNYAEIPIAGSEIRWTVRYTKGPNAGSIAFEKANNLAGGGDTEIKIIDTAKCTCYTIPADSRDLPPNIYEYDVEIVHPTYGTKTTVKGRIKFLDDVTK